MFLFSSIAQSINLPPLSNAQLLFFSQLKGLFRQGVQCKGILFLLTFVALSNTQVLNVIIILNTTGA